MSTSASEFAMFVISDASTRIAFCYAFEKVTRTASFRIPHRVIFVSLMVLFRIPTCLIFWLPLADACQKHAVTNGPGCAGSAERITGWVRESCEYTSTQEAATQQRLLSSTTARPTPPDLQTARPARAQQHTGHGRRTRSPASTARAAPSGTCRNSLPPEGQSPASHTNARVSCACEQCLVALHAYPQTRCLALQVTQHHEMQSVIPEGDEESEHACAEAMCSLHVQSEGTGPPTPIAPQRSASQPEQLVMHSKNMSASTGLSHCTPATAAIKAEVYGDAVHDWYTPFSNEHDAAYAGRVCAQCFSGEHKPKRVCRLGLKPAGLVRLQDVAAGAGPLSTCSNGSDTGQDAGKASPGGKHACRKSSHGSALLARMHHHHADGSWGDLQRSVTCQALPSPFREGGAQGLFLHSHGSMCASAELASLCLPSVTLTTTISQAHPPSADMLAQGRLRSCPSIPAGPRPGAHAAV